MLYVSLKNGVVITMAQKLSSCNLPMQRRLLPLHAKKVPAYSPPCHHFIVTTSPSNPPLSIHPNCCVGPAHGTDGASGLLTGVGIISVPMMMMPVHGGGDCLNRRLRCRRGIVSIWSMPPPASWTWCLHAGRSQ